MPAPLVPQYEVLDRIGQGGMGEVWRARHRTLGRLVAVKCIRADALAAPAEVALLVRQRFEREARAAASLHSPHTIQIFDFGAAPDGKLYLVMELLDGLDLDALVTRFGPVPPARAVALLRQAAEALVEAHDSGVIHRDLKPSNVYACRLGPRVDHVKLLDFGLARGVGAGVHDTALTQAGAVPGTPAWLAPELLRGVDAPTDRVDIYALGCIGYWLLTGRYVFDARAPIEMVIAHLERPAPSLAERGAAGVPSELAALLSACLAKDPAARPSAKDLLRWLAAVPLDEHWDADDALAWWTAHVPPAAPAPSLASPAPRPAASPAEQEAAFQHLRRAYEGSRIDLGDYERRLALARQVDAPGAIELALADLPAPPPSPPTQQLVAPPPPWSTTLTLLSHTRRVGAWTPDPRTRLIAVCGGAEIDLREAPLPPGLTELRCFAVFGNITLIVPPDLPVETGGVGVMGSFDVQGNPAGRGEGDGPRLRITGVAAFGSVDVQVRERPKKDRRVDDLMALAGETLHDWMQAKLRRIRR